MNAKRVLQLMGCAVCTAVILAGVGASELHAQPLAVVHDVPEFADGRTRAVLLAAVRDAQANGIPVEPLYGKMREGLAKQSPPDRIAAAVKLLSARLASARRALSATSSTDEIAAGAEALQMGVPVSALTQLRRAWPAQQLTVPLGVVTELVAHGVSASHATARVRELMEAGASNAQLVELSARVQTDIVSGTTAGTAFERQAKSAFGILSAPQVRTGGTLLGTPPRPG